MQNRKYQVFISSSFVDLEEARDKLIAATLRQDHIPFGMEMLKPGAVRSLDVIEQKIKESDIFVVLVGARLGSRTGDENSLAFTQQEYKFAVEHKLPVLAFLLEQQEYKEARDAVTSDHPERRNDEDLKAFRRQVTETEGGTRNVGYFSYNNLDALSDLYSRAIDDCVRSINENGPVGGWVDGDEFDALNGRIHLSPSVSDNAFFRDFAQSLDRFSKLSKRTNVEKRSKEGIASYFWQRYFSKLHDKKIRTLYFESGSSVAYVSREFIHQVRRQSDWWYQRKATESVHVLTNNILTYLQFLLQESPWQPMDVRLNPSGPVSDDYGGTYGILSFAPKKAAPGPLDALRTALPRETETLVKKQTDVLSKQLSDSGLILMTASGVDTRSASATVPYPGPHVGSYENMLLKRCLLSLGCPKVMFLHPDKLGFEFRFNNCHAVCDQSFSWSQIRKKCPLAIAMSAPSREEQQRLASELEAHGFTDIDLEEPPAGNADQWAIIAANRRFSDFFRAR
jgi:hypothetical protein